MGSVAHQTQGNAFRVETHGLCSPPELFLISNPCDVLKAHSQVSSRLFNQPSLVESIASFLIPTPKTVRSVVCLHLLPNFWFRQVWL
ncbi:hypothetical protein PISMIDRAFT_357471 [Pisolithus microcarpus 441]|uniref:Uncharacterized protein n=1 Tax=Pisolithus microcarpus 441 TaxID=765257 RepID=A0A0C9YC52_9AGAM|nr:hypothetical protein BKA83DRAFT_357471 [Pisolithus microcarpus]KIK14336.1 hypothetical protein PISMIDRAFT_357471 [Pisolithus microcarpus 441]